MGAILTGIGRLATSGVGKSALGKLLPLAGDLAALTGIGTGLAATGGFASSQLGLNDALGLSAEKVAKKEDFDVNKKNADGTYGALKGWDIGDDFRSLVTGVSKEDVLDQKRGQVKDKIQNDEAIKLLTEEIRQRGGALGLQGLNTEYDHSMRGPGTYTAKLKEQQAKIAQFEALKAIPGASLEGLSMQSSASDIERAKVLADEARRREIIEARRCYL